jgi:hypothetical protein
MTGSFVGMFSKRPLQIPALQRTGALSQLSQLAPAPKRQLRCGTSASKAAPARPPLLLEMAHLRAVSVVDLQAAINRFVVEHNAEPKPFTWTADPDKIIRAVRRGHQMLDSIH